ncbi:MAG: clostripain-related cysteine peptidase [Candidatus Azobacteroides sp.]|nr:clostripain-related cysteine peptidase [Candidatus Azobacteroides sp.]
MKTFNKNYFFFIFLLFFMACMDEENDNTDKLPERIVLAYFAADNNLSGDAKDKIEAMQKGWNSSINGRLFIFYDTAENTELMEICLCNKGKPIRKTIQIYDGEINSADPETLSGVIHTITDNYPASSYGLIVFSHASGWLPEKTLSNPAAGLRSIIIDKQQEMEFTDFAACIPENTFDFIIFEACFMSGIEIAYELKDKTDYIVASSAEIVEPGFCTIYETSLSSLFKRNPDLTGFTEKTFEYFNSLSGAWRSATWSVINTGALDNLGQWMINNCQDPSDKEIDVKELQKFNRTSYKLFFDFGAYVSRLVPEARQEEFQALMEECIIYKAATPLFMSGYTGFTIHAHSGLTTYIPDKDYPLLNRDYKNLSWYKNVWSNIQKDFPDE